MKRIMKKHCTAFRWLGVFFAIWGVLLMRRSRKRQAVLPYCIATSFIILGVLLVKPLQDENEQIETDHEFEASLTDDIEPNPSHPDEEEV